jgi:hypothetical protein
MAHVQQINYFFWKRWFWQAKFYTNGECTPYDIFDGWEKTESAACDAVHAKYEELIPSDD